MEVNGLIQVRQNSPLIESLLEANGKVIERCRVKIMTMRMECKGSSMKVNGLIEVR
jgi:hypothetical protein